MLLLDQQIPQFYAKNCLKLSKSIIFKTKWDKQVSRPFFEDSDPPSVGKDLGISFLLKISLMNISDDPYDHPKWANL